MTKRHLRSAITTVARSVLSVCRERQPAERTNRIIALRRIYIVVRTSAGSRLRRRLTRVNNDVKSRDSRFKSMVSSSRANDLFVVRTTQARACICNAAAAVRR